MDMIEHSPLDRRYMPVIKDVVSAAFGTEELGRLHPLIRFALSDRNADLELAAEVLSEVSILLSSCDRSDDAIAPQPPNATEETFPQYVNALDGYYVVPNKQFQSAYRQFPQNFRADSKVLDIGAGTGRNGLVAALSGADVDLVERSSAGCEFIRHQANQLAISHRITVYQEDVVSWKPAHHYDAVVAITILEHLSPRERRCLARKILSAMRPESLLVATAFVVDEPGDTTAGVSETASHIDSLLSPNELKALFEPLEVVSYREHRKLDLSHGDPHYHCVAELVAQAPSSVQLTFTNDSTLCQNK